MKHSNSLLTLARKNRKSLTPAERKMWTILKDNQMGVSFRNYYDNQKTTRSGVVAEWTETIGTINLSNTNKNAVTSIVLDPSMQNARPTSTALWFYNFANATRITGLNYLNTSEVTNMRGMFYSCEAVTTLDVSGFDTKNVTDMGSMFNSCEALTTLDLSGFNTRNVTDMSYMFYGCEALTTLNLSGFDTRNVTNMGSMFVSCSSLTTLDLSGFDTPNVTDMGYMFCDCEALTTLNLSRFNTRNVTYMGYMFADCRALTTLDLSGFDTPNVTNMGSMFFNCNALTTIYCNNDWSQSSVLTYSGNMFYGCEALVGGNGTTYDANYTNATYARPDGEGTPGYFTKETEIYATLVRGTFTLWNDTHKATSRDVVAEWTEKYGFVGTYWDVVASVTSIVLDESMQDARPTSTYRWFADFVNATQITGLNYLNTSEVTDMSYMFSYCEALTTLDVSGFDTRNVTDMSDMFSGCESLTTLDVSGFDTKNVTVMGGMFPGCKSLTTLDLSGFDTRNVMYMDYMFFDCESLTTIYCNDDWSQSTALVSSYGMFGNCWYLVGGNWTTYDDNHTDITYARPDEEGTPGYFTKKDTNAIDNVSADKAQSTKFFRNGMLIIRHGDKEYNAQGIMIK